ncbi:MAG: PhzF family phenazine biosynthesis protein [Gammaproteobacteria bacterium]
MRLKFYIADVFSDKIFHGAQIAVFPRTAGLDAAGMQLVAREFNLPGTVFVLPPADDTYAFRARIFLPGSEIEFGSHAVIAAAYVLATIGEIRLVRKHTPIVLKLNAGPIQVYVTEAHGKPIFVQFTKRTRAKIDRYVPSYGELADILALEESDLEKLKYTPLLVSCDYPYLIVPLRSYATVRRARFDFNVWSQSSAPATFVQEILLFSTESLIESSDFHGRLVGPKIGVTEDPPIGSAIPAFAHYLCRQPPFKRGTYTFAMDRGEPAARQSVLNVEMDNDMTENLTIRVGGAAVLVSEGEMTVPAG